ncbi:DUF1776-domain-containing protein [Trichodelitschia bisporula]|uniref:DUF1776-domain-containing protein n=1 Tax=Trichodelitschia bisporula TaxID=703511 RepID=A0A6G1HND3_9PEZI|nr:DUF1776-domain-containing protein [Trichodelitschia bisporula]
MVLAMPSDEQNFLDFLAGVSSEVRSFSANMFDATDRHIDAFASTIRSAYETSTSWLPGTARHAPSPPPPPPHGFLPVSYVYKLQDWVSRNRALTAAIVAFVGTGAVMIWTQRKGRTARRRARRASNGARKEVVVIAGPPNSPVTKSLMLDLEKRGFMVYVVVTTTEDEQAVQQESLSRADIRPFHLPIGDALTTQTAIERFNSLLNSPHHVFPGASPHELRFMGLILAPDVIYQSGPIEAVAPELWSDQLQTKVLGTIATAQALLPTICDHPNSRVLVLTPTIVSSLKPPFHGMESTIVGALEGFSCTLRRELSTVGIDVVQIKLGSFDFSGLGPKNHLQPFSATRTYAWPATTRALYAQNFVNQGRIADRKGLFGEAGSNAKGSHPRELHHAVFDALTQTCPQSVWRVGRGSVAYDAVGKWVPAGLVGWLLGIRRVSLEEIAGPPAGTLDDSVGLSWETVEQTPGAL